MLDKLEDHLTKSYNLSRGSGVVVDGVWLEIHIAQVFSRKIKDKEGFVLFQIDQFIQQAPFRIKGYGGEMGLKENTIRNYRGLKRILTAFENYRGAPLLLAEIDKAFVESLTSWMMSEMNYSVNYTSNTLKLLKAICSEARKNGVNVHYYAEHISCFNQREKDRYLQILTSQDIYKIKNTQGLTPKERIARACILIGLCIGQRVSDLLSLEPKNIRE